MPPNLSVFANVSPASFKGHYTVDDVLKTMRSDRFKTPTDHLRSLTDAEAAKIYKAGKQDEKGRLVEPGHFYGVTWSGTFKDGKKADQLQDHSRLLCMDVDGLTTNQVITLHEQLCTDEYTHVLFISPSGNGVKWVVRIDLQSREEHKAFFRQVSDYLHDSYGLSRKEDVPKGSKPQIDPSGSDVSRLCFLPYAPDAYHNPDSEVMPLLPEYQPTIEVPKQTEPTTPPPRPFVEQEPTDDPTHQRLTACISELHRSGIDLTATYEDWVKVGLSLASMGEEGRTYYHEVSRLYPTYDYTETDAKFSELLRNRTGQVNIGSFFHLCEQATGYVPKSTYNYRTDRPDTAYDGSQPNQPPTDTPPPVNQEWQELQPLTSTLFPVMAITPDMIPEPLRPWLTDIAYRMKCPLDFVASAAVVMLSSLIGTRLTIKPKTRDDWSVVPNLWGAIIGGPSSMKTPSTTEVLKPLNRLVFAARTKFADEIRDYDIAMVDYEAQKKAYATQALKRHTGNPDTNPVEYPKAPEKPKERRYMVNDSTVEKLADLLNDNPTGLLLFRDELMGLLASWDRAGHEQDRAFHLEAWNGSGHITIDRIGRGTTHVNIICESLFGGIQPAKLLPYLQSATGYENDGFVQRLQVAVFPDATRWEYGDDYPDKAARDKSFTLIQQIADSDFKTIGYDAEEYDKLPYTRFNADAQEIFKQWLTDLETRVLPGESGLLLEHFTKYRSLMPALALIFHVVNCINNPVPLPSHTDKQFVSVDATRMAVRWCEYLMSHARRIYGLLDTASIESAKELLRHLKAGNLKNGFKVRDVYRKQWTHLKTTEQAEAAVSELVTRYYLEEVLPPAKAGRPEAPCYLINPKIHPKA